MSNFGLDLEGRAVEIIKRLKKVTARMVEPAADKIVEEYGRNPFLILVSCVLSWQTKDTVSFPASCKLFQLANTPKKILDLKIKEIERVVYPVSFYRNKARYLHEISRSLIKNFGGKVPNNEKELLSLYGVGRKTANLVLGLGFGIPAICVDTHVHRISNRLGLVKTKTPEETEKVLQKILPKKYWIIFNSLLVKWGQNICVPISPFCSNCAIFDLCEKVGVKKSR